MNREEIDAWLEGRLEPQRQAAFEAWLAADPQHADAVLRVVGFEQALRRAVRGRCQREAVASGMLRWRGWAAAAAVAAAAGLLAMLLFSPGEAGIGEAGDGLVRQGTRLDPGEPLAPGPLQAGPQGGTLAWPDARIAFAPGAAFDLLAADGLRGRLLDGVADCTVEPQPAGRSFALATPHGSVRVIGTRFRLEVRSGLTRVEVASGAVELAGADGRLVMVPAGGLGELAEPAQRGPLVLWDFLAPGERLRNRVAGGNPFTIASDAAQAGDGLRATLADAVWTLPSGDEGRDIAARCRQSGAVTLAGWFAADGATTTVLPLVDLNAEIADGRRVLQLMRDPGLSPQRWSHRAVSIARDGLRTWWHDGRPVAQDRPGWSPADWSGDLHLKFAVPRGHYEVPDDPRFSVRCARLAIWDRALTSEEIAALAARSP